MKVELAPIVSDARGRFAGTVFSNWRGIPVVRQFTPPSQPRTDEQVDIRNLFRNSNILWREAGSIPLSNGGIIESYNRQAYGQTPVGRNFFIGDFADALRGQTDMEEWYCTAPSGRVPRPASIAVTPSGTTAPVVVTSSPAPSGFTLAGVGAYVLPDFNPEEFPVGVIDNLAGMEEAQTSPGAGTMQFTGLESGSYWAYGFSQYLATAYDSPDPRHFAVSSAVEISFTIA